MSCPRSSVVASSGRASLSLPVRSISVVRIHARSSRHCVVGHIKRGLSVPLRWRPAHGTRSARSRWSRPGASRSQAWAFRAGEIAGFGHEGLAVQALVSEHSARLPASQCLKPQCVSMQPHSTGKLSVIAITALVKVARVKHWRPVTEVSASKAKRQVVQQTPNQSIKRTCLRHAAYVQR